MGFGWLKPLVDFFSNFFAQVFIKAMETPAIKEVVDVQEGDAPPPPVDSYDDLYGLCDRNKGEA